MKINLVVILIFLNSISGNCQFGIIDQVIKIDVQKEINMIPDTKSYVKTVELFNNNKITRKYTEESFYNYEVV